VQAVDPNAAAVARPAGAAPGSWLRGFAEETAAVLKDSGLGEADVGVVGVENMSLPLYMSLTAEFGQRLKRVDNVIAEMRAVKSADELELMRHAAHMSDAGYEKMLDVARPGTSGVEIVAEMEREVRLRDADYVKYWMASGPPTTWDDTRIDLKPHERVVAEGDFMCFCSYVIYKGY
jgi:Xaa-Pro aminopeptidase